MGYRVVAMEIAANGFFDTVGPSCVSTLRIKLLCKGTIVEFFSAIIVSCNIATFGFDKGWSLGMGPNGVDNNDMTVGTIVYILVDPPAQQAESQGSDRHKRKLVYLGFYVHDFTPVGKGRRQEKRSFDGGTVG